MISFFEVQFFCINAPTSVPIARTSQATLYEGISTFHKRRREGGLIRDGIM